MSMAAVHKEADVHTVITLTMNSPACQTRLQIDYISVMLSDQKTPKYTKIQLYNYRRNIYNVA